MKKYLCLLLAAGLLVCLCACGGKTNLPTQTAPSGDIQLVSCRFANEICGADGEVKNQLYQQTEGKVYVDLRLSVVNRTGSSLTKADFSGVLHYQDEQIPMQYCRETESGVGVSEDAVASRSHSYVHLFTRVPKEAMGDGLTVSYTLDGKTYQATVDPLVQPAAMDGKTKLEPAKTVQLPYIDCRVTLLEAGVVEKLQATNQAESFYPGPYALVKLQLENGKDSVQLTELYAYTAKGGELTRIPAERENQAGTDFVAFSDLGLAPGEQTVVYLFIKVEAGTPLEDNIFRFNLAGNCFYVNIP